MPDGSQPWLSGPTWDPSTPAPAPQPPAPPVDPSWPPAPPGHPAPQHGAAWGGPAVPSAHGWIPEQAARHFAPPHGPHGGGQTPPPAHAWAPGPDGAQGVPPHADAWGGPDGAPAHGWVPQQAAGHFAPPHGPHEGSQTPPPAHAWAPGPVPPQAGPWDGTAVPSHPAHLPGGAASDAASAPGSAEAPWQHAPGGPHAPAPHTGAPGPRGADGHRTVPAPRRPDHDVRGPGRPGVPGTEAPGAAQPSGPVGPAAPAGSAVPPARRGDGGRGSRRQGAAEPGRARAAGRTDAAGPARARTARGGGQAAARSRRSEEGRQRRWGRVVKAVGFCASVTAAGMLLLRGNEAVAALAARPAPTPRATVAPVEAPDPGSVVQIVAHPDDDLYFMNPDLRYSLLTGHPVTTVYLTSGEADGVNAVEAKQATTPPNKPAYAEARQNGIRAAYAQMATGDRTSAWKRTAVPTKGGGQAELDVLVAKPQVQLVWLQLREAGSVYDYAPDSLHGLWDDKVPRLESMLASGSPVKQRFSYGREQLVRTLVGLLEQYRPTTVRSQDPTPGRFPDTKRYTDHQDHFYGARFVQAALAAYAKDAKDRPHFAVQNYLGYFNGSLPSALDPAEAKEKLDILGVYAWLDKQNHCGSTAGCGDLKVADHPEGNHWTSTVNYARGTGTSWLTSDQAYGLWAFKVLDGQVAVWHRAGLLGGWSGPRLLPGTGMDPGISTVTLPGGRIAAFGTRTSLGARAADYRREVVYAVQKAPGSEEFGEWQSLGTPEAADENWTSDISGPAVSVDGGGQLALYVRDGASTLRGRVQQANGSWGPWEQYGGTDLHGTPVTATDGAGRRMVFASTTKTVTGWAQPQPGAPLGRATATGLPDTTLPLTAEGREGGVRLWFRKPGSGNVRTALVTADGGLKVNHLTDLGGLQGFGSVTASGHVLAGRTAGGQLGSDLGPSRPWARSELMFVGAPSSTMTGRTMVSLAVLGLDARLYVTSSADEANARLAPWQPVGPRNTAP
ncbi:PIG-L family deacetylase [Streptomyces sp. NPDC044571]|uniref:PIG-L family deacetylase n=1 Tax=Streptomyces sp. NPDC044571 TaxID=3155371 RepID=UPI0033FA9CC8